MFFSLVQIPHIMTALQRSVQAVLLGRTLLPDFDVTRVSRKHMNRVLLERFGPLLASRTL